MRDDPASLSALRRVKRSPAILAMRPYQSTRVWRFLMIYPRRFFGSVRAVVPVAAIRLSSVSTKLLKVRFCSRAIACSCSRNSRSIRTFKSTFAIVVTMRLL